MTIISSTVWDSGSTTWDSGSTLWDSHRRIDGTTANLTLATFGATVTRPVISTTTVALTLSKFTASITRPKVDITVAALTLAANDASVIRPAIGIVNVPALSLSESLANVTRTTNVSLDTLVLTEYLVDVGYTHIVSVGNTPNLTITDSDTVITFTNRNLTFFLSQII